MPLPDYVSPCAPGASCTAGAQAAFAQKQQVESQSALLKATKGGGVEVGQLQTTIGGPAGASLNNGYVQALSISNQAAESAKYDNLAANKVSTTSTTGGKKRSTKRRHWSAKYKKSINCKRPKGFSQRQHCKYGRKSTKRRVKRSRR
jgi:hypothetical protein